MTEEEKKAINLLKTEILDSEKLFEEVGCYKFFNKDRINAVKVILNIVENNAKALEEQQNKIASQEKQIKLMQSCDLAKVIKEQEKEIEEEKEKWKELFHEYNKLVGEIIDKEQDLKDSISKDKIRSLLPKINGSISHFKSKNDNHIVKRIKRMLEDLLEEN